ncbi:MULTISPECIES: histidine kinase [Winogradskyella]|uniref:sensor histidine kinase n=1 Tax=Winogradskyella TaxID=286104 RepID=UPI0015CA1576|nr:MULTISPECIES: histidine kinase [Winogradskyella]QXP79964.1 histidine kinase [Winogradskyella sp. HaHa_3_26]
MLKKTLLFIVLLLGLHFLCAQEPVSIHLTEKDGLPDIEFYNILEDSKGFVWLAADTGLYRYDGKTYTQYTNAEKRGLSIFGLFEDTQGRIWCTNISGQFFYVENNQLLTFIDLKEELKGQLGNYSIQDNKLLITTSRSLYIIDLITKKILLRELHGNGGARLMPLDTGYMLISFDAVKIFNNDFKETNQFLLNIHYRDIKGMTTAQGQTQVFKLNEILFFSQQFKYKNMFRSINLNTGTTDATLGLELLKNKRIIRIKIIKDNMWVLTHTGIYIYENDKNEFTLKNQILEDEIVTDVIIDKDQNFWVSTLTNGIHLIPNIEVVKHKLPEKSNDIMAIDKVNDSVVFFGSKSGVVGFLNVDASTYKASANLGNKVSAIQYNSNIEYSYVSIDDGGYFVNNKTLETIKKHEFLGVKSFSRVNETMTLFGTYSRLAFLNNTAELVKTFSDNKRIYTTYYSENSNTVFIGYVDDLLVLDNDFKSTTIRYKEKEILAISITETADGIVWVGTFKNGIFAIRDNQVIAHYTTKEGLLSDQIKYLKADENSIWIATPKGLQVFNTDNKYFKNLTKTDGLLSYKISGIEVLNNRVVLSSNKGVFSFDKEKVFKKMSQPEIYFNDIKINEKSTDLGTDYDLDYNQNSVQFSFNVNGVLYNINKTYQYRLVGYNNNWITTDLGVNTVKYSSLPVGEYTFQVRPTSIIEGTESNDKSIKLNIKLPYWKKWWFILAYSLSFVGLIILYYKRKLKKKEIAKELEIRQLSLDNELIALKLENLRSQMNPHFIFNALNSIQEYIMLNQKKLASEYLGKFADLIRTYLSHSTKGKITLQEEIDCLEMYLELEKLRFEDKLHYVISTSGNLKPDEVNIPTMLVQPYVENALKHGLLHRKTDRNLRINFFINDKVKTVRCIIVDNGVGRAQAEKFKSRSRKSHPSFATKATQDRLALLNYGKEKQVGVIITDLFDKDIPVGTQVDITIPYTTG